MGIESGCDHSLMGRLNYINKVANLSLTAAEIPVPSRVGVRVLATVQNIWVLIPCFMGFNMTDWKDGQIIRGYHLHPQKLGTLNHPNVTTMTFYLTM